MVVTQRRSNSSSGRRALALACVFCSVVSVAPQIEAQQTKTQQTGANQTETQHLQQVVQAAQTEYIAGHPAQAAALLEPTLPKSSASAHLGAPYFPVEELLGLCYAAMSQDARAVPYLEAAARLKPQAEEAHTNLAASLLRLGRNDQALDQFRRALALAPQDYTANHNIGEFYIQQDNIAQAVPYLDRAQRSKPTAYDNGYDLAMAQMLTGQYASARLGVQSLRKLKDAAELHNLEGQIDEKDGRFVEAANEFEAAAHMEPSEENIFDWGSELLLHRTYEPAIDVFRAGVQRYPGSARLQIGLGMTLYARGLYEDSVKALLAAADLAPSDPRCYLFLSRAYDASPSQADDVIQRFQRYAALEPKNGRAQFYYAMSLWKGKRVEAATVDMQQIETLLKSAIALDDSIPEAHFQLGNLYAGQHLYEQSVPEYQRTIALDSTLADAHYRLATDYTHMGSKPQAQAELAIYQKLRAEHMAAIDKERAEVQQFVYNSKGDPPAKP